MCNSFANFLTCFTIFNIFYLTKVRGKYVEGEINTKDDWAFLARFCFLSEEGQFEYRVEFNEERGYPNLLLYYDTDDQWPSVYKSGKTCPEKESVLKVGQNQVVNLTVKTIYHQEFSGCVAVDKWKPPMTTSSTTPKFSTKKYTEPISVKKKTSSSTTPLSTTASTTITTTTKSIHFQSTTDFSTEVFDYFNASNTPELYDYNDESVYHNFEEDVENIFPNDDQNDTGPIEVYTTIESSPRRKRSVVKNTTPKQQILDRTIICQNSRRFRSSRERWWFIAVSNCGGNRGIHIKYKLLMTNGPPGDYWHEHFSADEFYVLPVLLAYSVAYSFLLLAVIVCTIELKARQLLHSTYKLFTCSILIQFFGVVFKTLAYMKFAFNGLGAPKLKTFGEILMACSEACFLLVLILLAKGYTVTRGRLSVKSGVKVTIFMCIYSVTYVCLFIYQEKVFDPGEVLYLYESPAGYGLIFLKIIAWIMFIYSTIITLKHYPEKSNFYYPFNVFGTFWFVAGPAFILSANTYIDKWVRESVVNAVLLLITFGGHLMFLVLTMPSRANKNFPYHVRTTQIGIMEVAGPNSPGHFNHYPYEPSADPYEQTVIIPLTKRTEEIFGEMYAHKLNSSTRSTHNTQNNVMNGVEERRLTVDIVPDSRMQNVLSWAIAKDCSSLSVPTFERVYQGDSFRSTRSRGDEVENNYSSPTFGVQKRTEFPRNDFSDYIKDVPVELFTMRYVAAYLLAVLGGKASPTAADIEKILGSVGIESDSEKLKKVISELNGKSIDDLIAQGREKLSSMPAGGGGAAPVAAAAATEAPKAEEKKEAKKEEKKEESESEDEDMGFGLFD